MMRMDYGHLCVASGAIFSGQMPRLVDSPGLAVETKRFDRATSKNQMALAQMFIKITAKNGASRTVRSSTYS